MLEYLKLWGCKKKKMGVQEEEATELSLWMKNFIIKAVSSCTPTRLCKDKIVTILNCTLIFFFCIMDY